jgi:outer membrane protein assembly factor BamC
VLRILTTARRGSRAAVAAAIAIGGIGALGGCSWLHFGTQDETYDYRKATPRQQPLEVPPDLSQLPKDDRYSLPAGSGAAAKAPAATAQAAAAPNAGAAGGPAPAAVGTPSAVAGGYVAPATAGARIVREGNLRYLAVDASPELAYAMVKDLWAGMGLKIVTDEPQLGILETAWTDYRPDVSEDLVRTGLRKLLGSFDSSGQQNKYRARIERTAQNTSEITISHRGLAEVYTSPMKDTTKWQYRPSDPELEAEMLHRLALRFATVQPLQVAVAPGPGAAPAAAAATAPAPSVTASVAATAAAPAARAHKVTAGGVETLQVEDTVDRTWRQVGIALDRGGFTVVERRRDKNLFSVRYLDPDYEASEREKRGWWDRLFNSDAKVPEQQFLIVVSANGPTTAVEVQDKDGHPDNGATARHILDQLLEQLR